MWVMKRGPLTLNTKSSGVSSNHRPQLDGSELRRRQAGQSRVRLHEAAHAFGARRDHVDAAAHVLAPILGPPFARERERDAAGHGLDGLERVVQLDQGHPAGVTPSLMGHSIGRWEGETLVIDTVGFTPHRFGVLTFPSGPNKHLVERLALTKHRLQLEYAMTLEDPDVHAAPFSFTAIWNHRPDLEFSGVACDPEVSRRAVQP
jgi:hypothetical protein